MRNRWIKYSVAIAVGSCCISCAPAGDPDRIAAEKTVNQAVSPSDMFDLYPVTLAANESAAPEGDADAAFLVYEHYAHRELTKESDKWLQIGAENGNPLLTELLGRTLWSKGGKANCRRAAFWLRRTLELDQIKDEITTQSIQAILVDIERDTTRCN